MVQVKTTNIQRGHNDFVKPSELIDIHEISPLTLNDRRIFNELIANAWESIEEDKEHIISKTALMGSMTGNDRVEQNIFKLMGAIVQVKIKKDGWAQCLYGWKEVFPKKRERGFYSGKKS